MVQADFLYGHCGKWKHDPVLLPNASASCTYSTIKICVNCEEGETFDRQFFRPHHRYACCNAPTLTSSMAAAARGRERGAALIFTCSRWLGLRIQDIQLVGCLCLITTFRIKSLMCVTSVGVGFCINFQL